MRKLIALVIAAVVSGTASAGGTRPMLYGTLESGTEGAAYRSELTATGVTPIEWDIDGLPYGLEYTVRDNGKVCTVSGIPQEIFSGRVTVTITNGPDDESGQSYSRTMNMTVRAVRPVFAAEEGITLEFAVGVPAHFQFELTESPLEVIWSYSGNIPEGLMLDTDTGVLYGTPRRAGEYKLSVIAENANSRSRKSALNVSIIVEPQS